MSLAISGFTRIVAVSVVPGAVAGDITVEGDLDGTGDTLVSVRHVSGDLVTNADRTAEFSITGHNLINNDAGTSSAGDFLIITFLKAAAS